MKRRDFIPIAGVAALAGYAALKRDKPEVLPSGPSGNSAVSVIRAASYNDDLVSRMLEARGHEVVPFSDEREALAHIKADPCIEAL